MRLDHLLSKEHLLNLLEESSVVVPEPLRTRTRFGGAHGWNADRFHRIGLPAVSGDRGGYIDTLLGPERTDVLSRQKIDEAELSVIPRDVFPAGAEYRVQFCVLFENCTVDASIFVSKCVRAYGGCLGTRSR